MIAGHFGLATIIRAKEKTVPLWVLMAATQLLDIIFIPLLLFGIEGLEPIGSGYGEVIIHADYTHSFFGSVLISLIAYYFAEKKWGRKGGLVVGFTVFSHWILDFFVHRMDMPIFPGNWLDLPKIGLGLWSNPFASIVVESIIVSAGIYLYAKYVFAKSAGDTVKRKKAVLSLFVLSGLLVLSILTSYFGI